MRHLDRPTSITGTGNTFVGCNSNHLQPNMKQYPRFAYTIADTDK